MDAAYPMFNISALEHTYKMAMKKLWRYKSLHEHSLLTNVDVFDNSSYKQGVSYLLSYIVDWHGSQNLSHY